MTMMDILSGRSRDFKRVFLGTEEGQRVLAQIYKMCGMNRQVHTPGDPHDTSFKAGMHRVGQGIQSILGQDEQDILTILKNSETEVVSNNVTDIYDPYEDMRRK